MAMNTKVTAEAWIKVSRSGHWTRFSSAQQEAMNPAHGAALSLLRLGGSLPALLGLLAALLALLFLAAPLPAADPVRRRLGGDADVGARGRRGGQLLGRFGGRLLGGGRLPHGCLRRALLQRVEVGSMLGQLRLDHLGRLRYLGPLLGTAVGAPARLRLASGPRLSRSPLCLPLRPSLRHRYTSPRSAGLLVRGVPAAPVAVLAQLEPVGSVAARLVALVVASLALLAGERHSDSDFSAGHWLVVVPLFGPGGRRLSVPCARFSEKRPRPSHCGEEARGGRRIAPRPALPPAAGGVFRSAPPHERPSVLAMMLRWISEVPP